MKLQLALHLTCIQENLTAIFAPCYNYGVKNIVMHLCANKLLGDLFAYPNNKSGKNLIDDAFVNKRSTDIFQ